MHSNLTHKLARLPAPRPRRAGFTFTEIMFAVIVLGIGFIMLAGIFPVAVHQSQRAVDESTAASVGQAAIRFLQQTCDDQLLPYTHANDEPPRFLSLTLTGTKAIPDRAMRPWRELKSGMIHEQDPRYAWTALYSRSFGESFARVIIFVERRSRGNDTFGPADLNHPNAAGLVNLEPRPVRIKLTDGGFDNATGAFNPDTCEFIGLGSDELSPVAEGAFIVVASARFDKGLTVHPLKPAGRIYRLGNRSPGQTTIYELQPGNDLVDNLENTTAASEAAWIVGRAYSPDSAGKLIYNGDSMDVAAFSAVIQLIPSTFQP